MVFQIANDRSLVENIFKELISSIKIETQVYVLPNIRYLINEKLNEKATVENLTFFLYYTKVDPKPLLIRSVSSCQNEQALVSVRE